MNNNIEKKYLKRAIPKSIYGLWLSIFRKKNTKAEIPRESLKKGPFVAWPKPDKSKGVQKVERDIRVGRTKDGGYIAFPKE